MALSAKAIPEKARNRLLRRADWRFLLPTPLPERSICFADGLIYDAVRLISTSTSRVWIESEAGSYNLAVAINPDTATLQTAFKGLQAGGALYTEWYSPLSFGPSAIKRRLARVGFEKSSCYWPWPLPSRKAAQFWLPYQAPGALNYFLKNRSKPDSLWHKAGKTLLYNIWKLGLLTGLILPVCVVSLKSALPGESSAAQSPVRPGRRPDLAPVPNPAAQFDPETDLTSEPGYEPALGLGVEEILATKWQGLGFGEWPENVSWLLLTGGHRSISKVIGLVFATGESLPRLVVKMPRIAEAIPALRQEAATLQAVQSLRPGGLTGIPRILFCENLGESLVLGETALAGLPLFTRLRRDNYRELALKATDWLINLAANSQIEPRQVWWDGLVEPVLQEFDESFGSILGPDLLQQTRDLLGELKSLPVVCEHRDFSPWNVMLSDRGELEVLDWEGAELNGLPFLDLFYFLTYLTFFLEKTLDSELFRPTYQAMLEPATFTGQVFAECMERYADRVGLERAALRPLRLLTWIFHSRSEYRHFTADMARKPTDELLRHSLFFKLWKAELDLGDPTGPRRLAS